MGTLLGLQQIKPCPSLYHLRAVVDVMLKGLLQGEGLGLAVNQDQVVYAKARLEWSMLV